MFHVIVCYYNAGEFLERCLTSLRSQSCTDWVCHLYDDTSTDDGALLARRLAARDSRILTTSNQRRFWSAGNHWQLAQRKDVADDDVIVTLDGDDWLPDAHVLTRVAKRYLEQPLWLTYGNFARHGKGTITEGYCKKVASSRDVRHLPWTSSALRTFKAGLFRRIRRADLTWTDGWFVPAAGDVAMMLPMIEMAGDSRAHCFPEVNYCYNVTSPLNDFRIRKRLQEQVAMFVRRLPPYKEIGRL